MPVTEAARPDRGIFRSTRPLFRVPSFACVILAYSISMIGDWFLRITLPIIILDKTGSALLAAVAYAITFVPYIAAAFYGGVLADRMDRKRGLLSIDLISALVTGALLLSVIGGAPILVLLFVVLLLSSLRPVHHAMLQAILPEIVEGPDLLRAQSSLATVDGLSMIVGPSIAGAVVAFGGVSTSLFSNMLLFAGSAAVVGLLPRGSAGSAFTNRHQSFWAAFREGLALLWRDMLLRYGISLFFLTNLSVHMIQGNLAFLLLKYQQATSAELGFAFGVLGFGTICGGLVAPFAVARIGPGATILWSTVLSGLVGLVLLATRYPLETGAVWACSTLFGTINTVTYFTVRQKAVPGRILGRIVSLQRGIAFSGIPLAAIVGGYLIGATGIAGMIVTASTLRCGAGILFAILGFKLIVDRAFEDPGIQEAGGRR
jgi:MFS family permease